MGPFVSICSDADNIKLCMRDKLMYKGAKGFSGIGKLLCGGRANVGVAGICSYNEESCFLVLFITLLHAFIYGVPDFY